MLNIRGDGAKNDGMFRRVRYQFTLFKICMKLRLQMMCFAFSVIMSLDMHRIIDYTFSLTAVLSFEFR